jgi:Flp pilus assembly protein TadD
MLKLRRPLTAMAMVSLAVSLLSSLPVSASPDGAGRAGFWKNAAQGSPSLKVCEKAVEKNPQDAIANNDLGWAYRQSGNADKAQQYLRAAIKLNAKLSQAHSNLSVVLLDQGKTDEAISEAREAVAIDANNAIFHVVLGNALEKKNDTKGAIEEYRTAVKLKADYENALYHLGQALLTNGDKTEAKAVLSQALGLDAKDDRVVALLDKLTD